MSAKLNVQRRSDIRSDDIKTDAALDVTLQDEHYRMKGVGIYPPDYYQVFDG
jgi:hypothetical protein